MLFVSELKKNVGSAIEQMREIVDEADSAYITTDMATGVKVITEVGQVKFTKILMDMRGRENEEHINNLSEWVIGPNMPKVVIASNWQLGEKDPDEIRDAISWLQNNRLTMVSWIAFVYQLTKNDMESSIAYAFRSMSYRALDMSDIRYTILADRVENLVVNNFNASKLTLTLELIKNTKITKESYLKGVAVYGAMLTDLEKSIIGKGKSGIDQVFSSRPEPLNNTDRQAIRNKVANLFDNIKNGLSSRTWGFEIEVPDAKGVEAPRGIDKGDDGSLRSKNTTDCECDCRDCTYHECNCDNCDNYNEDPDHCEDSYCVGEVDSAEFRSNGGIQRVLHIGMLELCEKLVEEDAEMNDSAGTHIHVYAQDLTTNQVGQVMAAYHWLYNSVFWPIAGRHNNQYARTLQTSDIANALRKRDPILRAEKPLVVNVTQLLSGGRGTIEFRHQDCNLDGKLISVWAWLVRGLVEVAKRGATFAEYKRCNNLEDLLAVYAKYNFTPESENPGLVIVGSRSDEARVEKVVHKDYRSLASTL